MGDDGLSESRRLWPVCKELDKELHEAGHCPDSGMLSEWEKSWYHICLS